MTTFAINDESPHNKKKPFTLLRQLFTAFAIAVLFSGCTHLHFRTDSIDSGLLAIGQQLAYKNCRKHVGFQGYQNCRARVDENYNELYK